jgi:hypothetical protein
LLHGGALSQPILHDLLKLELHSHALSSSVWLLKIVDQTEELHMFCPRQRLTILVQGISHKTIRAAHSLEDLLLGANKVSVVVYACFMLLGMFGGVEDGLVLILCRWWQLLPVPSGYRRLSIYHDCSTLKSR